MKKPTFHQVFYFPFRYCVEFEVIKAAKACHKLAPYNKLAEGKVLIFDFKYEIHLTFVTYKSKAK